MSEVKLLPMGGTLMCQFVSMGMDEHAEAVESYARANMSPLQKEIERLREDLNAYANMLAVETRVSGEAEGRAEQLAEALRGGVTMLERLHGELGPCEAGDSVWGVRDSLKGALARAALDQEGGK